MNSYDPYVCNFSQTIKKAKKFTKMELLYAIEDATYAVLAGANPQKYLDELKIFKEELAKRK